MKRFTILAAVCLLAMTSCTKKICPAYTKADALQQHTVAKAATMANSGQVRM